jgi:hypothetical protein
MMSVVVQNLPLPDNVPGFYNDDVQQLDISTFAQKFFGRCQVLSELYLEVGPAGTNDCAEYW